jgi:ABC-2 type transport system ATP-binding protein
MLLSARTEAMTALASDGALVASTDVDRITVTGLPAERIAATLAAASVSFADISAHRATLEEAYVELTRETTEFRAANSTVSGACR